MNKDLEKQISQFLIQKLSPSLIYLFGSTAKGTDRPDSDIDIAFLTKKTIDDYNRFLLAQELASTLNREVDLVDIQKASTVFQMQILSLGKVLHCEDENERMEFEMKTFSMYARLNEERRSILKQIEERGSVYEE
ncbi:type VII toxin-antitoxin system MntA family adenylyltransferase antitoxin [Pseudalkalibacillus caeni]|uniref:Nucleotidyltransferase domain-containing protein n=1 Tax=Exobacillus caeni TaxID=2574798 RepID=A0A5R9FCK0_9BACL|nr:nucleotidyltransferase domain-containing protein [Pseudalkalibacillus caeni]TLS38603.1 nucleotidyltransferase domain-containing protein [Pseudalkalibacillus caeni]